MLCKLGMYHASLDTILLSKESERRVNMVADELYHRLVMFPDILH